MKRLTLLIATLIFLSCSKNDKASEPALETSIEGEWKLIEVLSSPGNAIGEFQPVESNKVITFYTDGTFESNGNICDLSIDTNMETAGTYDIIDSTTSITANITACDYPLSLRIDGSELIIPIPCFEPCASKYIKQ